MPKRRGFFAGSAIARTPPQRTIPQCGACGLCKGCRSPKMPPTGNGGRRVLFVAEAPGEDEDRKGVQLIGNAGQRLRKTLKRLGFDLDRDAWKTNAILCRPPKNRTPTSAEIVYCRPNINKVLEECKPHVIVPMGKPAVQSILGPIWKEDVDKIGRWTGWGIPCQELNAWVCPTYHPSYILREDDVVLDRLFEKHLKAAIRHDSQPWPNGVPHWENDVDIVLDSDKAARWLRHCAKMQTGAIAWDFETNMLKPDGPDARIVSCSVAWGRHKPERCIAFLWQGEAVPAMGELLRSRVPKIASNLKFECRWARKAFGHRVRQWVWDTMLAAHVLDNRPGITSVKFQALVRLGVPTWNDHIEPFLKTKKDEKVNQILRQIDTRDLLLYNGLDALLEFRVAYDQIQTLNRPLPWAA